MNEYVFVVALAAFAYLAGCFRGYGKGYRGHASLMPTTKLAPLLERASKFLRDLAPYATEAESYKIANEIDDVLDTIDPIYNPTLDHPDYRSHSRSFDEAFSPEFRKTQKERA